MKIGIKELKQIIREEIDKATKSRMNPRTGKPFPDRMSQDEIDYHLAMQKQQVQKRKEDPSYCDGHGCHEFRGRPGERWCQICNSPAPDNITESALQESKGTMLLRKLGLSGEENDKGEVTVFIRKKQLAPGVLPPIVRSFEEHGFSLTDKGKLPNYIYLTFSPNPYHQTENSRVESED